jgi:hypothetical protein
MKKHWKKTFPKGRWCDSCYGCPLPIRECFTCYLFDRYENNSNPVKYHGDSNLGRWRYARGDEVWDTNTLYFESELRPILKERP